MVEEVVSRCGLEAGAVRFLAQGSTSRVWWAETQAGSVVVRLADPAPGKTVSFAADVGLRKRLHPIDRRVAEPLGLGILQPTTSSTDAAVAWCLDRFIVGETAPRGGIPETVCYELGQVLSSLHALPTQRYGLLCDRQDACVGQAPDPVGGLLTRLQDPWPFTRCGLGEHPIFAVAPDLLPQLAPFENRLRALVLGQPQCLNHTDLHERQALIVDGHLVGLLDFGDATIGPSVWDIASFGYFHGWRLAEVLLTGYSRDAPLRRQLLAEAQLFALLIALHHASRAVTLGRPSRMEQAVRFLRLTLSA